jgi:hypothetical protein
MKRLSKFVVLPAVFLLFTACADLMVQAGLKEAKPPVTDSAYFSAQMKTLLARLKANRARSYRKAAVLDFVNSNGKISDLGRYLHTKFTETTLSSDGFKVVPKGQVDEALKKLNIVFDGKLTREQAKNLGTELKVDAIITGSLADLQKGSDIDFSVKAIQSASGELLTAGSINIYRSKQVQTLISQF